MRRRRKLVKGPEVPEHPGWRDYFQIVTTILMVGLGIYILWHTIFFRWASISFIFSVAILLFALFRIRMIWTYFQQRRKDGF